MKKSEIKRIQNEYQILRKKIIENKLNRNNIQDKLKELERRYFHETGRDINSIS